MTCQYCGCDLVWTIFEAWLEVHGSEMISSLYIAYCSASPTDLHSPNVDLVHDELLQLERDLLQWM